jgi:hypothetical protein
MNDDLEDQMYDIAEQIYEDQVALIVIGESEPCDDGTIDITAAGATVLPDEGSQSLLVDCIVESMVKDSTFRDIIQLAAMRYEQENRPNTLCLN